MELNMARDYFTGMVIERLRKHHSHKTRPIHKWEVQTEISEVLQDMLLYLRNNQKTDMLVFLIKTLHSTRFYMDSDMILREKLYPAPDNVLFDLDSFILAVFEGTQIDAEEWTQHILGKIVYGIYSGTEERATTKAFNNAQSLSQLLADLAGDHPYPPLTIKVQSVGELEAMWASLIETKLAENNTEDKSIRSRKETL